MDDKELWPHYLKSVKRLKHQEIFIPQKSKKLRKNLSDKLDDFDQYVCSSQKISLDLHKLTQDQAYQQLRQFILSSYDCNKRELIIITGKSGILKQEVPRWLDNEPISSIILEIREASLRDGGSGALKLYLKKKK